MGRKAYSKIAAGLTEALAVARGEAEPARQYPAMDVRSIRAKTGLTQEDFATCYGFTVVQVRDWEQGRSHPQAGVRAYLSIINEDHSAVVKLLLRSQRK